MKMKLGMFAALAVAIIAMPTTAEADPLGGTKLFNDTIGRDIQQSYDIILKKEESTVFQLSGDGRSDLDCFVYDENGDLVARDVDSSDDCHLTVTPRWTGHFTFVIRNVGNRSNSYRGRAF